MNGMLKKTNIKGNPISFQDTLILLKDALESEYLYLERKEKCKEGDSGWYVGLVEDNKKGNRKVEDYIKIYVYELLQFKPQLLKLLVLPTGCLAVVNGEEIVEVIDKNNNKIL